VSTTGGPGPSEGASTALPRWLAAIVIGTIAIASLVALVWPWLPRGAPTEVGTIRAQIEEAGAAGRISALAPNFEWNAAGGKTERLSDLRGRVVVLNFWATWCLPCREELPALNRVATSEPSVAFIAVGGFSGDTSDRVASFFSQLSIDRLMPVIDSGLATSTRYGVLSLPTTFFVDRSGVIRHLEIGALPLTEDEIRRGITKANVGEATPAPRADVRGAVVALVATAGLLVFGVFWARRRARARARSAAV
jgi:thiol-disulfide isomerase/thioredoxin